ncbi:MAG: hypothetical protein KGI54_18215 [Pseudomonadota bacterium]|nr:hypothetical protein [Pseudomonadota bacterium]
MSIIKVVPKSAEETLVSIDAVHEPVTINASVTLADGTTVMVAVPAAAVVGDFVKLNADGTAPATAQAADGSFLSVADEQAGFVTVG